MASFKNLLLKMVLLLVIQSVLSVNEVAPHPGIPKHFKKIFIKATDKCSAQLNVAPINLLQVLVNEGPVPFLITNDVKCYLLCIFQEFSMMDEHGKYKEASIRGLLDSLPNCRFVNVLKENLDTCLKEDADNSCEKAFRFAKCFYENRQPFQSVPAAVTEIKEPISPELDVSEDL